MRQAIARALAGGPEMSPIAIVATGVTSGTVAIFGGLLIRHGAEAGAVLGFFGGIGGAAIGAWLAVGGALSVERWKIAEAKSVQRTLLRGALTAIGDTAQQLRDGAHLSQPGAVLVTTKAARQLLESRRNDLSTIRAGMPIDSFAVFEALQILDTEMHLMMRVADEAFVELSAADSDIEEVLSAFRNLIAPLAAALLATIGSVGHALDVT